MNMQRSSPSEPHRRAPHLLMALLDAAIKLGEKNNPKEPGGPELADANGVFETAQGAMIDVLADLCKTSEAFQALVDRPKTKRDALDALIASQALYEIASSFYLAALTEWAREDAQMARIRLSCVDSLRQAGRNASQAKDEASEHPRYTEHKDFCIALSEKKNGAEIEMNTAKERVRNAREVLRVYTSEGGFDPERDEMLRNITAPRAGT